jgi:hypothetical protein
MATFAELITNAIDLPRLRRLALRVKAIQMALDGADFIDVFRFFLGAGQSQEESFHSAARVFRGGDVRGKIVFTKDVVYLQGLIRVHTFFLQAIHQGRPEYIRDLFSGRMALGDVLDLHAYFRSRGDRAAAATSRRGSRTSRPSRPSSSTRSSTRRLEVGGMSLASFQEPPPDAGRLPGSAAVVPTSVMFDAHDLHRLLSQPDADRTLSLYLRTDAALLENHAAVPGWRIWAKNALHKLAHAKPVPLAENIAGYGRAAIGPLLWAQDEYRRTLIAVVDKERARYVSGYMGGASREGTHVNDFIAYDFPEKTMMPHGVRTMGGSNRDAFAATEADHLRRFYQEVAEQIRHLMADLKVTRLVLGGSDEAAHAVQRELHASVAKLVVALVPIPHYVDDAEVVRRVLPAASASERARESALVGDVIDLAKSGGRGALGPAEVAACLERKQVELLLLPWPGEDVTLELMAREALAAGAAVELVSGEAAARVVEEGGVAARLFYATPAELVAAESRQEQVA